MWILLAAIAFGGCSIWAFHFVAMIALNLRIPIDFSVPLTIFSAVIAVLGTMLGLASNTIIRRKSSDPYLPVHRAPSDVNRYKPIVTTPDDSDDSDTEGQHLLLGGVIQIHSASGRTSQQTSRPSSEYAKKSIPVRMFYHLMYTLDLRTSFIGLIMGLTVVAMHYCGMKAMVFDGVIMYNWYIVGLSVIVAYVVCMVAIIYMPNDSDGLRQSSFAVCAATGVNLMHWTGIMAARFETTIPPPYDENIFPPTVLPLSVAFVSIITCLLSYVVLARTVTQSRDRLVEMVMTKRKLWKALAEKEAAERNDKVKTEFISIASHELRTPLHAITGFTDLLALTQLDDEQQSFVQTIKASCHALDLITKNVLDFTKLENENAETGAQATDLNIRETARNMIETCAIRIADVMSVELVLVVERNVPKIFSVDETYFARVIMNLVGNALKFTKEGYVFCRIWIKEDHLCVTVTDTGIGIAPDHLKIIFQPFRQADTSLTRKHQGTGLGLAICHQLIMKMGGRISLESTEGVGSTFTVLLPNATKAEVDPPPQHKLRVAILLRSTRTAGLIQQFLSSHYNTSVITEEKLEKGIDLDFDRCILDIDYITPELTKIFPTSSCSWFIYHRDVEIQGYSILRKMDTVTLLRRPIIVDDSLRRRLDNGSIMSQTVISSASSAHGVPPPNPMLLDFNHSLLSVGDSLEVMQNPADQLPTPLSPSSHNPKTVSFGPAYTSAKSTQSQQQTEDPNALILLVEDNIVNQHLGLKMLQKLNHRAELAENGRVALDKILADRSRYKLVLMDCQMPVLNGFEATKQIREWEKNGTLQGRLRIVSLTANVSSGSKKECEEAGSDRFLPKPLTMKSLKREIEEILMT